MISYVERGSEHSSLISYYQRLFDRSLTTDDSLVRLTSLEQVITDLFLTVINVDDDRDFACKRLVSD